MASLANIGAQAVATRYEQAYHHRPSFSHKERGKTPGKGRNPNPKQQFMTLSFTMYILSYFD